MARTPDLGEDLHVYARRGSPVEATLNELTASGPAPVTLAVRSVDRSHERRQFEVTRVLAPAWVVEQTAIGNGTLKTCRPRQRNGRWQVNESKLSRKFNDLV